VDHWHGHDCPGNRRKFWPSGCIDCVRANLCHRCNQAEGYVVALINAGLIDTVAGPMASLLGPIEDSPFQRWRAASA
jgi:hypothetical protein